MGKTDKRAKREERQIGGASASGRGGVAALAILTAAATVAPIGFALGAENKGGGGIASSRAVAEDAENAGRTEDKALRQNGGNATLEEAFFETLGRCESPILVERDAAEDALFARFAEFEPIWQDRRFLTNGEVSPEARLRFELAEARYREETFEKCVAAFETTFETVASENEGARQGEIRDDERKNGERDEEGGKDGKNKGNRGKEKGGKEEENERQRGKGESLRGRVALRWTKPLRIVYLAPDWSAFERRDAGGKGWRPSGRFSTPELAPEFDATELTLETVWERAVEEETPLKEEYGKFAENGEGKAAVVGVFEGLIGGDFRVWTLLLGEVAFEDARAEGKSEDENGRSGGKIEERKKASVDVGDFPTVFQSGDAVATVGETTIKENGETTARVRFDFATAFDAFDSHRVWCDKNDFELIIDEDAENLNFGADVGDGKRKKEKRNDASAETSEEKGKEANGADEGKRTDDAGGGRWTAIRLRVRERTANGALFELDFPNDATLREAVAQGRARLACRIPRFFFQTRFEVAGVEKGNDGEKVDDDNDNSDYSGKARGNEPETKND